MMGISDSDKKKAVKNIAKIENQISDLKKLLEKFSPTKQTSEEKEEIYGIMSEIEELSAMISI